MHEKVTVVLPTHNARIFVDQCLPPLLEMDYPNYDIILVDNCSHDDTVAYVKAQYPQVRVIALPRDSGHSASCNTGIRATDARYVYLVENHTVVTPETLSRLMEVMTAHDDAAICFSKLVNMYSETHLVIEERRYAHYVVNQYCERTPLQDVRVTSDNVTAFLTQLQRSSDGQPPEDVSAGGTVSYLLDKAQLARIGYFDEDYFIYLNDHEFTLRVKAAGLKCYYVPASLACHKSFSETVNAYNFRGGRTYPALRTYFIARNRWLLLLTHYAAKTLVVLSPALLVYELFLIGFVVSRGVLPAYLKAVAWLATHPRLLWRKRRQIQRLKRVSDADLLVAGELNFVPGLERSAWERRIVQALTAGLTGYWKMVKRLLA